MGPREAAKAKQTATEVVSSPFDANQHDELTTAHADRSADTCLYMYIYTYMLQGVMRLDPCNVPQGRRYIILLASFGHIIWILVVES